MKRLKLTSRLSSVFEELLSGRGGGLPCWAPESKEQCVRHTEDEDCSSSLKTFRVKVTLRKYSGSL